MTRWSSPDRDYPWRVSTRLVVVLVALSAFFILLGLVLQGSRDVLFAIGATGLFIAALTHYLLPVRFVPPVVCESTYESLAQLGEQLIEHHDLQRTHVYLPSRLLGEQSRAVALFVPRSTDHEIRPLSPSSPGPDLDVEEYDGISTTPSGLVMYKDLDRIVTDPLEESADLLAEQLVEVLAEGFELADRIVLLSSGHADEIRVGVNGPLFGSVSGFDHPIPSFLATGLVLADDVPVEVTVDTDDTDGYEYLVSFRRTTPVTED